MVARQLKILSQVDAFTISATRNIEHVFKKLVCLTVFVKDLFYIYLNQRTNGPVNAHLISWPSKAQNKQNLENIW